jgi:hypothetical protein
MLYHAAFLLFCFAAVQVYDGEHGSTFNKRQLGLLVRRMHAPWYGVSSFGLGWLLGVIDYG